MKTAYPNQVATYTVVVRGAGGSLITAVLSDASLTIGDGDPIAATVSGQSMSATVPADAATGETTFAWAWTQVANGVTSAQSVSEDVEIAASSSGDPANAYRFGPVSTDLDCPGRAVVSSAGGQYLYCEIEASAKDGSGAADPTSFPASVAFVKAGNPEDGDWIDAEWATVSGKHYAMVLIEADMLACGAWYAWASVADGAPAPMGRGGIVSVI